MTQELPLNNGSGSLEEKPVIVDVDVNRMDLPEVRTNLAEVQHALVLIDETKMALIALESRLLERKTELEET